jgi:hypothetical protein
MIERLFRASLALVICLALAIGLASVAPLSEAPLRTEAVSPARAGIARLVDSLPLRFEANVGQTDGAAQFVARGRHYHVFLTQNEAVVAVPGENGASVRMSLEGSNAHPRITPLDRQAASINYLRGSDPAGWHTNVASFSRVRYEQVYPGIDLEYYGNEGRLEYDFLVARRADPTRIRIALNGADDLAVERSGDLKVGLGGQSMRLHKPVAYQVIKGQRRVVDARYVLAGAGAVRFALGAYDPDQPLVIDPILSYSTYLGGTGDDFGFGIAVDSAGNVYVAGATNAATFPTTSGVFDTSYGGPSNATPPGGDAFVLKLSPSGALVYATFLGGTNSDEALAIAVDGGGNAYITGYTVSTNFPVTAGVFQPKPGQNTTSFGDAFVAKLNASGSNLVYSSYLGGQSLTAGNGIAVDSSGNAYVTGGVAFSFNTTNPLVFQPVNGSSQGDAFVVKVNPTASGLVYSRLIGGTSSETGYGLALDSSGNAYITGQTSSNNFPATGSAADTTYGGGNNDSFVAQLGSTGSVVFATYVGGSGSEVAGGIALDPDGNIYTTGLTSSSDFPTTAGALDTQLGGSNDAYVVKYTPAGAVAYSTFLGGSGSENSLSPKSLSTSGAIAVDSGGTAYVTGSTTSSNFPVLDAVQSTQSSPGNEDAFVSRLNTAGSALLFSSYLGGTSTDQTQAIAIDGSGVIYLTGRTSSTDFPKAAAAQSGNGGGRDVFITKITPTAALPTITIDRSALAFTAVTNSAGTSVIALTPAQTVRLSQSGAGTVTWTAASSQSWVSASPASGAAPATITIAVNSAALPASASATATITIALTGAKTSSATITVTLTKTIDTSSPPPIGTVDTPADNSVLAGSVAVTGWSLDNVGVKRVELWRDLQPGEPTPTVSAPGDPRHGKIFIANATFVDGARPDVEGLYATMPFAYRGGWGYLMLTWGLYNSGNGNYKLYAFSIDQEDHITTLGVKNVTFNNNAATKPFGSIDTPAIGGDASGPNFGWGLTPKVNGVATCKIQANGVQVSIDSGPNQPVAYGDARSDLASSFPGFSNSEAAGGHFLFDWTTLTNGLHTIGWLVTDDCNRADGVGSRYFNVTNGTSVLAAPLIPVGAASLRAAETESSDPITVAYGYGELPRIVEPGLAGSRTIEVKLGDRIELRTPRGYETAHQIVGGQTRGLPIGSTWDAASGTFYWQPAPGFLGRYRIVFSNGRERISVRVVVVP